MFLVLVDFEDHYLATIGGFEPFSINGIGNSAEFYPISEDIILTITTDRVLVSYDNRLLYQFQLSFLATGIVTVSHIVTVILHEIGKLSCCIRIHIHNFVPSYT